jgi:nicotinamidase-related amidase
MTESRPALLVMDVEPAVVERYEGEEALLERLGQATAAARGAGMPVI